MNLYKKTGLYLVVVLLFSNVPIFSQETTTPSNSSSTTVSLGITEVSLIKANESLINLELGEREAGLSIESSKSDSSARLLISSVVSTSSTRTLSAKITAGTIPSGTHLDLTVQQPNANFSGDYGDFSSPVSLDETDRPIVTNITSCYSGKNATDGYPLKFSYALDLNPATYGNIRASSGTQIVVTFTLTASQ